MTKLPDQQATGELVDVTKQSQLETPVLFLVFNRPDTTKQAFEAIRQAMPTRLYVAADGPRANKEGEKERCQQVRNIATNVDWPCEVKTLFRNENLGCRRAVSGAIDWFFEAEEQGIILEDDCVSDPSFFRFADELLGRFKDDKRIMCISAQHFHGDAHKPSHSYFFSRYNHCWGWASWRRAWQHYDHEMSQWPDLRPTRWLEPVGNGSRLFCQYWKHIFDKCYGQDGADSWAYRWTMSCWAQNGLTVLPAKNLVTNIGFGGDATHTKGKAPDMPLQSLSFPLEHPEYVIQDVDADRWADIHIFGITRMNALKRQIRDMPVGWVIVLIVRWIRKIKQGTQTR